MKKIIIILGIFLITLLAGIIILRGQKKSQSLNPITYPPSPNPTEIQAQQGLYIVAVDPANSETQISINNGILITLGRPVKQGEVDFRFSPQTTYQISYEGNNILINFTSPLKSNTRYEYTIIFNSTKATRTFFFTTKKNEDAYLPDTRATDVNEQQNLYELANAPDVFVANLVPYENDSFRISSAYVMQPQGHFAFTVELKGNQENTRQAFQDWLKQQGLTDNQIHSLDITYK